MIKSNKKSLRIFFFLIGIIATLAYRIIIVLNFYSPYWVKVSWYIGTIGFTLYFWHRYEIQKKRVELINKYGLVGVVERLDQISGKRKEALNYLVKTTATSKSRWNSLTIFLLSLLALIGGILLDLGFFGI